MVLIGTEILRAKFLGPKLIKNKRKGPPWTKRCLSIVLLLPRTQARELRRILQEAGSNFELLKSKLYQVMEQPERRRARRLARVEN